jgi:hypothetical protein
MGAVPLPARVTGALLPLGVTLLLGCGPPPQVEPTPDAPLPGQGTPGSPAAPSPGQPAPASPLPGTEEPEAVECDGEPDANAVLAALREAGLLDADAEVVEGPLCADDWQYAVVAVPDRDPLQVITSGPPDELTLETAGTEVCTIEVRVHAPRAIRAVAGCVG